MVKAQWIYPFPPHSENKKKKGFFFLRLECKRLSYFFFNHSNSDNILIVKLIFLFIVPLKSHKNFTTSADSVKNSTTKLTNKN